MPKENDSTLVIDPEVEPGSQIHEANVLTGGMRAALLERLTADAHSERRDEKIGSKELPQVAGQVLGDLVAAVEGWECTDKESDGSVTRTYTKPADLNAADPLEFTAAWLRLSGADRTPTAGGYHRTGKREYLMRVTLGSKGRHGEEMSFHYVDYAERRENEGEIQENTYGAAARARALVRGVFISSPPSVEPEPDPEPVLEVPPEPTPLPWSRLRHMKPADQLKVPVDVPQRFKDPTYLPGYAEVHRVLRLKAANPEYPVLTDLRRFLSQTFGDEGGMPGVNEYYTREYITELASYMVGRLQQLGGTPEQPIQMLEVAAGQGRLSYFLRQELDRQLERRRLGSIYRLATTDLRPGRAPGHPPLCEIEALGYDKALEKYKPQIVFVPWMPNAEKGELEGIVTMVPTAADWIKTIQDTASVDECLMIGDPDEHGPDGFGRTPRQRRGLFWSRRGEPEVVAEDGFARRDLDQLSQYQIGYTDTAQEQLSKTVSLRREA